MNCRRISRSCSRTLCRLLSCQLLFCWLLSCVRILHGSCCLLYLSRCHLLCTLLIRRCRRSSCCSLRLCGRFRLRSFCRSFLLPGAARSSLLRCLAFLFLSSFPAFLFTGSGLASPPCRRRMLFLLAGVLTLCSGCFPLLQDLFVLCTVKLQQLPDDIFLLHACRKAQSAACRNFPEILDLE